MVEMYVFLRNRFSLLLSFYPYGVIFSCTMVFFFWQLCTAVPTIAFYFMHPQRRSFYLVWCDCCVDRKVGWGCGWSRVVVVVSFNFIILFITCYSQRVKDLIFSFVEWTFCGVCDFVCGFPLYSLFFLDEMMSSSPACSRKKNHNILSTDAAISALLLPPAEICFCSYSSAKTMYKN